MAKTAEMAEVSLSSLKPYERNAKQHSQEQIEKIKDSIKEFGFVSPCLIDRDNNLIAGHGRVMAAEALGMKRVPCVYVEGLTEEQRRAYILADNRLTELGGWNMDIVTEELRDLADLDFDIDLTGFELSTEGADWFESRERDDTSREEGNDEYNDFLEKFEIKKTTDDCYTPDVVYEAVADWVAEEYRIQKESFFRPFYPGGDYKREDYKGKVVVDNPPFSILSEILTFYAEHGVRFFLFAPTLTLFSSAAAEAAAALPVYASVLYENGASVNTSFLTNLEPEDLRARTAPTLGKAVADAVDKYRKDLHKELPKYSYPDEIITAPMMAKWSKYGVDFRLKKSESESISALDAQKEMGKAIYGKGFIISERAAAERAAAHRWELSEREREIVKRLGGEE